MSISWDEAALFLPKYLSPEGRQELFDELNRLPQTHSYFSSEFAEDCLQGDGWMDVPFFDFELGTVIRCRVLLISNTCDMAQENERALPVRVSYSPLIRVEKFVELLSTNGISSVRIEGIMDAVRNQEISNLFYLPRNGSDGNEYIVQLDNMNSTPPNSFFSDEQKKKIFSLNQVGFWYFLLKLSIHFCRANEGLARGV